MEDSKPTLLKRASAFAALFATLTAALLFFYQFKFDRLTILNEEIQNTGHIPFFGLLTLLFVKVSELISKEKEVPVFFHYKRAFGMATALGIVTELSQISGPRNADPMDLARNILGSLIFLGVYSFFDPKVIVSMRRKGITLLISLSLGLLSLTPLMFWKRAVIRRDRAFPVLCDFDYFWVWPFYKGRSAGLSPTSAPDEWKEMSGKKVGKLDMKRRPYAGFKIKECYPDWRGYQWLTFQVFSLSTNTITLEVKIIDFDSDDQYSDRFNQELPINPGMNQIRISLRDVENGPTKRKMDLSAIHALTLFAEDPKEKKTVYLSSIQLEK